MGGRPWDPSEDPRDLTVLQETSQRPRKIQGDITTRARSRPSAQNPNSLASLTIIQKGTCCSMNMSFLEACVLLDLDTHVHGPGCGHEPVNHGDHVDYLVSQVFKVLLIAKLSGF